VETGPAAISFGREKITESRVHTLLMRISTFAFLLTLLLAITSVAEPP
jgi:hypothetical protein